MPCFEVPSREGDSLPRVKTNNIMLQLDGHIKVVDFGLCKEDMWHDNTTSTFCGNSEFMAPEVSSLS
jgi:serine/threonine protein kinase